MKVKSPLVGRLVETGIVHYVYPTVAGSRALCGSRDTASGSRYSAKVTCPACRDRINAERGKPFGKSMSPVGDLYWWEQKNSESTLAEEITCYGQTIGRTWAQEWYDSSSGDARKRAAEVRKAGLNVRVSSMGSQVTPVGTVKMTLVDIDHGGDPSRIPPVKIERMPR